MGKSFSGIRKDVSVVLCGSAGMGVQTVERLLVRIFKQAGYHVFATKEYMSRVRGGMNSVTIRVSSKPVQAEVDRIDVLIPLDKGAIEHVQRRLTGGTLILAEPDYLNDAVKEKCPRCMEVAFTEIAKAIGNKLYSNVVAVGVVGAIFGINPDLLTDFIRKRFSGKEQNVIDENVAAVEKGYEIGNELCEQHQIRMAIEPDSLVNDQILVNGVEAVGLGAIAGGCNFIGAYPMSPSTGLLTFLAKHAREFGIVVEQAEDEIAGVNMAIGAWVTNLAIARPRSITLPTRAGVFLRRVDSSKPARTSDERNGVVLWPARTYSHCPKRAGFFTLVKSPADSADQTQRWLMYSPYAVEHSADPCGLFHAHIKCPSDSVDK